MRVSSADQQPVRTPPPAPQPRRGFAELLGDAPSEPALPADLPEISRDASMTAATFQEFGMFGRRSEVVDPETTLAKASVAEVEPSTLRSLDAARPSVATPSGHSSPAPASDRSPSMPERANVRQPSRGPLPTSTAASAGDAVSTVEIVPADEAGPTSATVRRRLVAAPAANEASARLTLSDTDGATGLVVRLAGLSAEEAAQFRSRAQTVLRERGLSLDKLNVNGEDRPEGAPPTQGIDQWR